MGAGTGAWESALTNTLSPGDRIVSFLIGQFSLLWIDQQQRLNFNVDVIESEWGQGANLDILASKLSADSAHTIKAICIVHNETATGVTNNLAAVRRILGKHFICKPCNKDSCSSLRASLEKWLLATRGPNLAVEALLRLQKPICMLLATTFRKCF